MALTWEATTPQRVYTSQKDAFRIIPEEHLCEFRLEGFGVTMGVNLLTGALSMNGQMAGVPSLDGMRAEANNEFKLYYFQRAFMDYDAWGGSGASKSQIEYAVCGWENSKHRAYWKIDGQTGKVFLHLEDVK